MRRTCLIVAPFALALAVALSPPAASAASLTVVNHSFENPDQPDNGAQFVVPPGWTETAAVAKGVVDNGWNGGAINVVGIDQNQLGWMNTQAGNGIFQLLGDTYQVGSSYDLTVGVVRAATAGWTGWTTGFEFQVQLYYGAFNVIAFGSALAQNLNDSNGGALTDVTASLGVVQASDPWAGQTIGVRIISTVGNNGDDWAFDNVRVEHTIAAVVPSPGALPAGLALLGLAAARRRRG